MQKCEWDTMNVLSYNITRQKFVASNAFFSLITYVKLLSVGVIPLLTMYSLFHVFTNRAMVTILSNYPTI